MTDAIIVALITGVCAIIGQMIISKRTSKDLFAELEKHQAVTDTKIDELTREVREHNNFAVKMPAYEQRIHDLERRVGVLEQYHKGPTN